MVRAPRWNEMEAKKKLIRTESWSWNQHLIDYGDSLSRRKPPNQRKMSVLQTLRRRLSVTPVAVSKDEKQQGSGTGTGTWAGVQPLLGRGYSSGEGEGEGEGDCCLRLLLPLLPVLWYWL